VVRPLSRVRVSPGDVDSGSISQTRTSDRANDAWTRTPVRAYYTLHYSEPDGIDCGFHCEPNPHVDGLLHCQEREDANGTYTYQPVSFGARSVTGLLWEMMDALGVQLDDRG
jgi:hypothetical protein